ncbi:MAG: extracellular solute-binding protein [Limnochordia bacterium]|nr:extracellular solute-binding protein [Limnochordia bacterium]
MRSKLSLLVSFLMLLLCVQIVCAEEQVTVQVWHSWDGARMPQVDQMIAAFEEQYPWIKVEHNYITWEWWIRNDQILLAFASNVQPDVLMLMPYDVMNLSEMGLLIPLEGYMDRHDFDPDVYLPGAVEPFRVDGKTYAIPASGPEPWVIARNRSMFAEAGLADKSPETWRELTEVSKKLTRWDGDRLTHMGLELNVRGATMYQALLYAAGGSILSEDGTKATVDSEVSTEVLQFAQDFYEGVYGGFTAVPQFLASVTDNFYTGARGMDCLCAPPIYWLRNLGYDLDLDYGPIPVPDDSGLEARAVMRSSWAYAISNTGDDKRQYAAYLVAEWLSAAEEGGNWFMRNSTRLSPVIEANFHPDYLNGVPNWETFVTLAVAAVPMQNSPAQLTIDGPVGQMWRTVIDGSVSAAEAAQRAQFDVQKALDDYYNSKNK